MKKRVIISAILAGTLILGGCNNSVSAPTPAPTPNIDGLDGFGNAQDSTIKIVTTSGGSVDVLTAGSTGTTYVDLGNGTSATVMQAHLSECRDATTGSPVICGPKEGVTYVFQSDFGALGPLDNDKSTPDGGVLLFDALTEYEGTVFDTPVEPNTDENRIEEVYIPTNYIMLSDSAKAATVNQRYEYMRTYLANVCNMKCISEEPANNPYFINGKTEGTFVATYVMHFTRGTGESTLLEEFKTDTTNLEYLSVSFELKVEQVDGDSNKLRFTSPEDTAVVFGAKKVGGLGLQVVTSNINLNSILHESVSYVSGSQRINMARYFDKLIAKGESNGVADFAKEILVENFSNPWPVKIYGTLHEINTNGTFQRSFVRNPAELNASLFGLDLSGPYKDAFKLVNGNTNQSTKFNIVYPGGVYNKLD